MNAHDNRCSWPTGTVWTGPKKCGKPAKARVITERNHWLRDTEYVCGIHRRVAERNYQVTTEALR